MDTPSVASKLNGEVVREDPPAKRRLVEAAGEVKDSDNDWEGVASTVRAAICDHKRNLVSCMTPTLTEFIRLADGQRPAPVIINHLVQVCNWNNTKKQFEGPLTVTMLTELLQVLERTIAEGASADALRLLKTNLRLNSSPHDIVRLNAVDRDVRNCPAPEREKLTAFAVAYVHELTKTPRDEHATNAAFRRWSMQRLDIVLLMHDWDVIDRPGGWDRFVSEETVLSL